MVRSNKNKNDGRYFVHYTDEQTYSTGNHRQRPMSVANGSSLLGHHPLSENNFCSCKRENNVPEYIA